MLELLFLLGAVYIGLPFAVGYLFCANRRLARRLARIEVAGAVGAAGAPAARSRGCGVSASGSGGDRGRPATGPGSAAPAESAPASPAAPSLLPSRSRESPEAGVPAGMPVTAAGAQRQPGGEGRGSAPGFAVWLRENWLAAVAAASLALAGLFAVQYALARGMLGPGVRLVLTGAFGLLLVASGEVIRRRSGDGEDVETAYLPSVFSGAGLVVLAGAVLAAHTLYAMLAPGPALALLAGVAAASVVLGWFYGPMLAGTGVAGAMAAPFLVGGDAGDGYLLYAYFTATAAAGLAIGAVRGWVWLDRLAVGLAIPAMALTLIGTGAGAGAALAGAVLVALAVILPGGALRPHLAGPCLARALWARTPVADSRVALAGIAMAGAVAALILPGATTGPAAFRLGVAALVALFAAAVLWAGRAPGLRDLALLPALGLFAVTWAAGSGFPLDGGSAGAGRGAGTDLAARLGPVGPVFCLSAAAVMSALAGWRSLGSCGRAARAWAGAAAALAPIEAGLLELAWAPAAQTGTYSWALALLGAAGVATLAAERVAQRDGADRRRTAFAGLAAVALIALALSVALAATALTVALALTVLAAAHLDARYDLRPFALFIVPAVAVLVRRGGAEILPVWLEAAARPDLLVGYAAGACALLAAAVRLRPRPRPVTMAVLESGGVFLAGAGGSLAIALAAGGAGIPAEWMAHWSLGLAALVWMGAVGMLLRDPAALRPAAAPRALLPLVAALVAAGRGPGPGADAAAAQLRRTAGLAAGAVASLHLLLALTATNPLFAAGERIAGPVAASSLVPAYLVPGIAAVVLGLFLGRRRAGGRTALRRGLHAAGGVLVAWYVCLSVAQAWRGPALAGTPMPDGELWSYTAALLVAGSAFLVAAMRFGSGAARRVGNGLIVAAIAKVVLVDAADLDGLMRSASFLALGLCLAGLAWLNRRLARRAAPAPGTP